MRIQTLRTKPLSRRLFLESLEDRRLLAVVTDSLLDRLTQQLSSSTGRNGAAVYSELGTQSTVINGNQVFGTSSTIKVPILYALLRLDDANSGIALATTQLNSLAQYGNNQNNTIAPNTNYSLRYFADTMIDDSNNWATNRLIDFVGFPAINQEIQNLGLSTMILDRYMTGTGAPTNHGTTGPVGDYRAGFDNESSPNDMISLLRQIDDNNGLLTTASYNAFWTIMEQNFDGGYAARYFDESISAVGGWEAELDIGSKDGSNTWDDPPLTFVDDPGLGAHIQRSAVGRIEHRDGNKVFYALFVDEASTANMGDAAEEAIGAAGYEIVTTYAQGVVFFTPFAAPLNDGYVLTIAGTAGPDVLAIVGDPSLPDEYEIDLDGDDFPEVSFDFQGSAPFDSARFLGRGDDDELAILSEMSYGPFKLFRVDGGGGTDVVRVGSDVTLRTLKDGTYTSSASESFTLVGIENAALDGDSGPNKFIVTDWSGDVELSGFQGIDTFDIDSTGSDAVKGDVDVAGGSDIDTIELSGGAGRGIVTKLTANTGNISDLLDALTLDFSFVERIAPQDFGDAPDSYRTLLASDGARHTAGSGLILGSVIDVEPNGQDSSNALGDDAAGQADDTLADDDDGVTIPSTLIARVGAAITVTASAAGKLDAWIDFNRDGDFDAIEKIFNSIDVVMGANNLQIVVPDTALGGSTFARFRLSSAGGLLPTGSAPDGEVEDYATSILVPVPGTIVQVDDPANPGNGLLLVTGRETSDAIVVRPVAGNPSRVEAYISPPVVSGNFAASDVDRIVVLGLNGSDSIVIDYQLTTPATVFGDAGHDAIAGGSGSDYLDGGAGYDSIAGGNGNDILVGGADTDYLSGDAGRDLILGGSGLDSLVGGLDDDLELGGSLTDNSELNYRSILQLWTANIGFNARITSLAGKLNSTTVVDDGVADYVYGSGGRDWLIDFALRDYFFDFDVNPTTGDKKN